MDLVDVVAQHGGTCTWTDLRRAASARAIRRAVTDGTITRIAKGRYVLGSLGEARDAATTAAAVASHTTAALHWGWGVKKEPKLPHLTLPRGRKLRAATRNGVVRHWRSLPEADIVDSWVTSQVRTVLDCCLDLPFDQALAVADSALRAGLDAQALVSRAKELSPRQRRQVSRVLVHASSLPANPFESVLRAICIGVPGLTVEPQVTIKDRGFYAKVDLADQQLRIVIEAESLEFHADSPALKHDCRRYTGLAGRGWVVLRFTWHEVMTEPDYVRKAILMTVEVRQPTASCDCRAAG